MAIYSSIEELKNAINDSIYANDSGLITAEDLQQRLHDIIDTLNSIGGGGSIDGIEEFLSSWLADQSFVLDDDARLTGNVRTSEKGVANGVAELDSTGKVPSAQLPSYVDDVIEVANYAALPSAPNAETGKIYVTLDTNITYRWGGSAWVEISASLALGETSGTAYRGDRGKAAYDHANTSGNPHGTTAAGVGALAVGATAAASLKLLTGSFTIEEISNELVIKYGATVIGKITSAGYLKMKDEIEPFAAV